MFWHSFWIFLVQMAKFCFCKTGRERLGVVPRIINTSVISCCTSIHLRAYIRFLCVHYLQLQLGLKPLVFSCVLLLLCIFGMSLGGSSDSSTIYIFFLFPVEDEMWMVIEARLAATGWLAYYFASLSSKCFYIRPTLCFRESHV